MNWLVSILEKIFRWTFDTLLVPFQNIPCIIFTAVICFGLLYWLMWQKKYNAQAAADENQIK